MRNIFDELQIGIRVYYTGDFANVSDFGTITKRESGRWGEFVDVTLDDGRIFTHVFASGFDRSPGQRFKTMTQYNQERAEQLAKLNQWIEQSKLNQ